jgi:type I restriction enzyme S subunit
MAVGRVTRFQTDVAINQDLKALFPREDLSADFLKHWLSAREQTLLASSSGSTVNGIRLELLNDLPLLLPPLSEQEKIAYILESIEASAIATRRVIEQTRSVKRALMQELLTHGILGRHTRFKDTPLGKIPIDWSLVSLGQLGDGNRPSIRTGPFGSSLKTQHFTTDGVPVLTIGSLGEGYIVERELFFIPRETAELLADYVVHPGDLVFSRVADVGRSAVIRAHQSGWIISSNLMRICLDQTRADPDFVYASIIDSPIVKKEIRDATANAGSMIVTSEVMKTIKVPLPPLEEQKQIVKSMHAFDLRAESEYQNLSACQALKSVLTARLLSGEIRVGVAAAKTVPLAKA